jgi:hypothetical protein
MTRPTQIPLDFPSEQRLADIEAIHRGTALYTATAEIEALLDRLGWPQQGETLLDPGAGNGGFIVAALGRLRLPVNDVTAAAGRVKGYEFHPGAVREAREAVFAHLLDRGWSHPVAHAASHSIIEERDFLLDRVPCAWATAIAANPPYWRLANLPPSYRMQYECIVPAHARADLLYAYLERSAAVLAPGGRIGLITADRWLFNVGAGELRARLGQRFRVIDIQRLDALSAFYRPKSRRKNTPPRVHPVSLVLSPGERGRSLGRDPFRIEALWDIEGIPLKDFAQILLAPWLGPDGIFVVQNGEGLPAEALVPVVDPQDIDDSGELRSGRRWAIVTDTHEPDERILAHLASRLDRMPRRGMRGTPWLPPETFAGRLPLGADAVLIPRIARRLRPIRLPAFHLPIDHHLIVSSPFGPDRLIEILEDPCVQAQANVLAAPIEGGYRSYSANLLRQLIIPRRYLG